jgi:glycosyltransferase involved in cell wall biosynthesis
MRLLIIAVANSVHTGIYLNLLRESGWEVELFDSQHSSPPHPDVPAIRVHTANPHDERPEQNFTMVPPEAGSTTSFSERAAQLSAVIDDFQPDVIHSHEIQHSGALVDIARGLRGGSLPAPWLQTSWGSDVSMYGRHGNYIERIVSVLGAVDYFGAECHRDIALARAMGFRGESVGVWPVVGGLDAEHVRSLARSGPASERRTIAVKGVLGSVARGEVAVAALERVGELMAGYEVCTYQTASKLEPEFRRIVEKNGGTYNCLSGAAAATVTHDEILAMHGRSRVSLALNNSDGMSSSFMEAVAAGSFPVHSEGSCGHESTPAGRGAIFVSATDPDDVAAAVIRALTDDALVNEANRINEYVAAEYFDRRRVRARILDMYERIHDHAVMGAFT